MSFDPIPPYTGSNAVMASIGNGLLVSLYNEEEGSHEEERVKGKREELGRQQVSVVAVKC